MSSQSAAGDSQTWEGQTRPLPTSPPWPCCALHPACSSCTSAWLRQSARWFLRWQTRLFHRLPPHCGTGTPPLTILAQRPGLSPSSRRSHHRPSWWLPILLFFFLREALVSRAWSVAGPPGLGGWGAASQPAGLPLLGIHAPGCRLWSVGTWQVETGEAYILSVAFVCPPSHPLRAALGGPECVCALSGLAGYPACPEGSCHPGPYLRNPGLSQSSGGGANA